MGRWENLRGWQLSEPHAISKTKTVPCWRELLHFCETILRKIFVNFITLVTVKITILPPAVSTNSMHCFSRKRRNVSKITLPLEHQPEDYRDFLEVHVQSCTLQHCFPLHGLSERQTGIFTLKAIASRIMSALIVHKALEIRAREAANHLADLTSWATYSQAS